MKSWMTSLGGLLTAIGAACMQSNDATVVIIGRVLSFVGPVLLGLAAKDFNVTGGTRQQ